VTVTLAKHVGAALAVALVLVILSYTLGQYRQYQMAEVAAWVTAVAGLTILVGLSGQLSVGNGAFMAVGAFATALLLIHVGWPIELIFVASVVITAVAGAIFGVAAARLRGPYLAGATLMLAVAVPFVAVAWPGVFGGDQGLDVLVTVPGFLGPSFPLTRWLAWLTCAFALVVLILLANLAHSRVGRSWRALRDDDVAASLAGLNVARMRVLAFIVSSACAGLGGALLATWAASANPDDFSLTLSIGLLTATVLGGLGSLPGAIWGSLVLVLVPSYLTNLGASHGLSSGASASVPIAVYGVVLILVMLLFPTGIQGGIRRFLGLAAPAAASPLSALRRQEPPSKRHQEKGIT
jgi:branched-chain amino acid transport system permease protein